MTVACQKNTGMQFLTKSHTRTAKAHLIFITRKLKLHFLAFRRPWEILIRKFNMRKSYLLQGMTLIYKGPSEAATRGVQ